MTGSNVAFVRGMLVSLVIHAIEERKFKSSVKYEEYSEPAFGLRPNEKRDGIICLGCVRAVYKWRKSGKPTNQVGTPFLHDVSSISMQSLFMIHLRHLQSHGSVV